MHDAWIVKHRPRSAKEVVGNRRAIEIFERWLRSWEHAIPTQRAAFLHGPPGIGKTVIVEALAQDLGAELIERNASDYRTEEKIRQVAGFASQYMGFFGKNRIILLDEMDGVYGTVDRGAIPAITEIIKNTRYPIVLIANDFWNKKFVSFRDKKKFLIIEFKKPSVNDIFKHLKKICVKESLPADDDALRFLAQRSQGDVRSGVNDLQALGQGKKRLLFSDVSWLAYRDRKDVIFSVLRQVLYSKSCKAAKQMVDLADVDIDMLFEWIYENLPYHFNIPSELAAAMEALATADLYRGRIRQTQNWKLMRYVIDFMTAGVAMARRKSKPSGWVPFRFPQRIRTLSTSRAERKKKSEIGKKIKQRMHVSVGVANKDVLPFLKIIFESDPSMAAGLAGWFNFNEEEIIYVAGGKRQANAILSSVAN
ncbi:MAG: replication factor C large subunit [Candidatus Bathyarchaeota archaeon]|nr:MAG: replication factor C large subunit [Candidatus Bathyarchaeota archaeon]